LPKLSTEVYCYLFMDYCIDALLLFMSTNACAATLSIT